jgi:[ribosomal protein S18]-alanine N-acetyltransferase
LGGVFGEMVIFEIRTALASSCVDQMVEIESETGYAPWSALDFQAELSSENSISVGAFRSDILVGYCLARLARDQAELLNIAVRVSHRRQGIARLLISTLTQRLERAGAVSLFLDVRVSNTSAQSLYAKVGFTQIGKRTGYYRDGEDSLQFALKIN